MPAGKMNCIPIVRPPSYERLAGSSGSLSAGSSFGSFPNRSLSKQLDSLDISDNDISPSKEARITFFNDNGSCKTVLVEDGLGVVDLCQLLAMKNHVAKDPNWTIFETHEKLGLERILEDHEDMLSVQHAADKSTKFVFRKEEKRYEFFQSPSQYFPPQICSFQDDDQSSSGVARSMNLQNLLSTDGECPVLHSHFWYKEPNKQVWNSANFILKGKFLYFSQQDSLSDSKTLSVFADLSRHNIYTTMNAKRHFRAPGEFGIVLAAESEAVGVPLVSSALKCLACDSETLRISWIAALRMAKFNKQLRDNYREFRLRHQDFSNNSPASDYSCFRSPPLESVRSRVAMDFTGKSGKIIDDPQEVQAIALAEGFASKRRKGLSRHLGIPGSRSSDLSLHLGQPWFHQGISRETAVRLLHKHGSVDGVFLVRESRSDNEAFVLSFICCGKVCHLQIHPVEDRKKGLVCFSLDHGKTKFYDLLQLVEFYQLNMGCLPTRLTYYIVASQPQQSQGDRQYCGVNKSTFASSC